MIRRHFALTAALLLSALIILNACQGSNTPVPDDGTADLTTVMSQIERDSVWNPVEPAVLYQPDNLYDLMNGQSDAFFVYGFEQAAVQRFQYADDAKKVLIVSIFQVDAPDSAYGLFTINGSGESIQIGNGGVQTPGQRLAFWQSRYFVQMTALKPVDADALPVVATSISKSLPNGGVQPELVDVLPEGGSEMRYFHQELSIQDSVYLGGENLLGLSMDTNGVMARYEIGGAKAWLVIIEYPESSQASEGLRALQSGKIEGVVASKVEGVRLGAVFGEAAAKEADDFLKQALTNP